MSIPSTPRTPRSRRNAISPVVADSFLHTAPFSPRGKFFAAIPQQFIAMANPAGLASGTAMDSDGAVSSLFSLLHIEESNEEELAAAEDEEERSEEAHGSNSCIPGKAGISDECDQLERT